MRNHRGPVDAARIRAVLGEFKKMAAARLGVLVFKARPGLGAVTMIAITTHNFFERVAVKMHEAIRNIAHQFFGVPNPLSKDERGELEKCGLRIKSTQMVEI